MRGFDQAAAILMSQGINEIGCGCQCGAIRYEVSGEPPLALYVCPAADAKSNRRRPLNCTLF